jgi:hypothetical protein
MTKETLLVTLEAERLKPGNDGIAVPEDRDATFLVSAPGETIQVGRVVRVELRDTSLCLETSKGERYWFTYDLVLGVRLRNAKLSKENTTGFGGCYLNDIDQLAMVFLPLYAGKPKVCI